MIFKFTNKIKNGFSILEITVVIFIITMGLISILALATQNIRVSNLNKNELIASQLAQEGLELVRNIRDTNWLIFGNDWKTGAGAGTGSDVYQDGTYAIDYSNGITDITGINDAGAKLKINGGFYEHNTGTDTIFYRLITVDNQGNYLNIDCEVKWILDLKFKI
jgi:type II secretory pathway pseudopilin PulG